MKLRDHYDWVVLGNHPAALLSGALVARLKLAVLILPISSSSESFATESNPSFDPEPNFLMGLGKYGKSQGLVLECLNRLGISEKAEENIQTQQGWPQALTPSARLAFAPQDGFQFELYKEFGKALTRQMGLLQALKQVESDILTFWNQFPRRLTLNLDQKNMATYLSRWRLSLGKSFKIKELSRSLLKEITSHDTSLLSWLNNRNGIFKLTSQLGKPELKELFEGIRFLFTGGLAKDPTAFDILHMMSVGRTGASFRGGMRAYREMLLELARAQGADVATKMECRRLFIEKKGLAGVQVINRGSMISATAGILGCSLSQATQRMNSTKQGWFSRDLKKVIPAGWRFTIALTVRKDAIPPGVSTRMVWQEKDAPFLEFEITQPEYSQDFSPKESDSCVIYLRTLMPYTDESLKPEYQRLISGRMMQQAMQVFPFLEFHIMRVYPHFQTGSARSAMSALSAMNKNSMNFISPSESFSSQNSSKELTDLYGFQSLSSIPDYLLVYSGGNGLGFKSGIDRLFIGTEESYPELGNFGATLAALEATAWIAHRHGHAGPWG